jgi:hypothetical protein
VVDRAGTVVFADAKHIGGRREGEQPRYPGAHLRKVFRKLGVNSRITLAAAVTCRTQDAPPPAPHTFN